MKNKIIDLGMHAYADTFIKKNQLNMEEPIFPLSCYLDSSNSFISTSIKTNEKDRYNLYEYSYTSSNSKFSKDYWLGYSKKIINEFKIDSNTKILEIGSNDGYLLKQFKKKTNKILGVDASSSMARIANKNKIRTVNNIFSKKSSLSLKKKYGKFDIIIANNVLNHANDPFDFTDGIKNILSENGTFIYELPYWYNLIKMKRFDQIYHEHVSYMTAKSSFSLLKKSKLQISKIEKTPYHGGSIRVFSHHSKNITLKSNVAKLINKEEKLKLFNLETYKQFMKDLSLKKIKFLKKVLNYKSKGYKIVGLGAAAKANTFLTYIGLNNLIVDFVTDTSKHKLGKYTPLTRIPIYKDDFLKNLGKKVCVIPLAWNIEDLLYKKIMKINKNIKLIKF
tara:strand:- start:10623 stop:11798 length:1176 start_codon:yes stop_codon:yes gene_type:complete